MQPRLNQNYTILFAVISLLCTHPQEIIEAVEGVPIEGVEVCDNVVESEGPDHGASEELPRRPALANVS